MNVDFIVGSDDGSDLRIGIVQSRFNNEICDAMLQACLAELKKVGVAEQDVLVCSVPGALEIPQALTRLARLDEFDALIALGAVIKGDTYHFEVVSNESAAGVSRVSLEMGVPIANAILTTYTEEQARARMQDKGAEAARVAVEIANLGNAIDSIEEQVPQMEGDGFDDDDGADDELESGNPGRPANQPPRPTGRS